MPKNSQCEGTTDKVQRSLVPRNNKTWRKKRDMFLSAYRVTGNITEACESADCTRAAHYYWQENDAEYPSLFEDAREEARERLEAAARERAEKGLRRMKFTSKGDPIIDPSTKKPYTEHVYSDTLAIFLLKGIWPEKYGDKVENTIKDETGAGQPLLNLDRLETHEVDELLRLLAKAEGKDAPKRSRKQVDGGTSPAIGVNKTSKKVNNPSQPEPSDD